MSQLNPGAPVVVYWEPVIMGGGTTTESFSQGTVYFEPFSPQQNVAFCRINMLQQLTTQPTTTMSFSGSVSASPGGSSGTGQWSQSGTVLLFSRVSTGTAAASSQIISFKSSSYSYGIGYSASVSRSTAASSATVSWTTSGAMSFISQINTAGAVTTGSFGTSSSSTFTSTSTNAQTFSSSYVMSLASQMMSQVRALEIGLATTLPPGEYWLGHLQSSNSASTNFSLQRLCMLGPGVVYFTTNTTGYAPMGSTATMASSNIQQGWGSYSASSQTSTTIPLSQISNHSQFQLWFNLLGSPK